MKKNALIILLFTIIFSINTQAQITQCEDTCRHIHGLDMSHYQGNVFWEAIGNNSKMAYVYLKATEGSSLIDKRYQENIYMARQHGLKVGSYHFYRAQTPQEEQLRNFRVQCRPEEQDLVPMIDVETIPAGMSNDEFCDSLLIFIRLVERTYRCKPLLYTYTNFYNKYLVGKIDGYPLMIAQYNGKEPVLIDNRDITMWQYTGKGKINGVNAYVDKSRFLGRHTMREIRYRRR